MTRRARGPAKEMDEGAQFLSDLAALCPPPQPDRPLVQDDGWQVGESVKPELAQVIRALLRHRDAILAMNSMLPLPQNACCFSFGQQKVPLPVGALFILWDQPGFTSTCGLCGGTIYAFAFGGVLNTGGLVGICSVCGREGYRPKGGLSTVRALVGPLLEKTAFRISGGLFGGCVKGDRRPLVEALRALGADDLPGEAWISAIDPPAATLRIK
jgi:hypothetical protein